MYQTFPSDLIKHISNFSPKLCRINLLSVLFELINLVGCIILVVASGNLIIVLAGGTRGVIYGYLEVTFKGRYRGLLGFRSP